MKRALKPNSSPPVTVWLAVYLPALAVLAAVAAASVYKAVPVEILTQDMAAVVEIHPLTGILSNLGILLWCASAAVSLFTWMVLWRRPMDMPVGFLLASGLLTLQLLLDDLFLFHEELAEGYLGIGQATVMALYVLLAGAYVLSFRRTILRTEYILLASAVACFAVSILFDAVEDHWTNRWQYLIEDGFKFLGICNWCAYHVRTALAYIEGLVPAEAPDSASEPHFDAASEMERQS